MITKEAKTKNKFTEKRYFASSARMAFSHILKYLFKDSDQQILMPAYIGETDKEGSGVFDPIRGNNIPYEFYIIRDDLSADPEDLKNKISSGKFKAVVIIHYFGFVRNDLVKIKSLCKENDVVLIEDCAHSFHSSYLGKDVGTWGDLSLFSIHKIIATPNGGYFKINNENLGMPGLIFQDEYLPSGTLEEYIRTDYDLVNRIRIQNYLYYCDKWKDITGVNPMYPQLPDGIVPLNFPIIVENGFREKLYFKLVKKGIVPVSSYYRQIHEINRNLYPISYEIASSILNLPVHQDITFEDIDYIIRHLKNAMNELYKIS